MFNLDCSYWSPGIFYVAPTSNGIKLVSTDLINRVELNLTGTPELDELIESSIQNNFNVIARVRHNKVMFYSTLGKIINDEQIEITIG